MPVVEQHTTDIKELAYHWSVSAVRCRISRPCWTGFHFTALLQCCLKVYHETHPELLYCGHTCLLALPRCPWPSAKWQTSRCGWAPLCSPACPPSHQACWPREMRCCQSWGRAALQKSSSACKGHSTTGRPMATPSKSRCGVQVVTSSRI